MWAVAGGRLISVSASRSVAVDVTGPASIRHVATAPGVGTAHVVDRSGDDRVVVDTRGGDRVFDVRGEALHPAWSPAGQLAWARGSGLDVADPSLRRVEHVEGPRPGATLFSPVFVSNGRIVAVVSAPPTARAPHGSRSDDLWMLRLSGGGWRRLTAFRPQGDRWIVIRTPVMYDRALHFVRVAGRASATGEPRFELWRLERGGAHRVRRLEGERYLAGTDRGRLVWNVPDPSTARDLLVVEGAHGPTVIGCGAVTVDPIDITDPDRRSEHGTHVPDRGHWPELEHDAETEDGELAVIVGDFEARTEAEAIASEIAIAYPAASVEVVDATTAPLAIGPGVFGALLHLPPEADPTAALSEFRDRLPRYSSNSWIVTP
jgi:hypothetical protein